jgi:hypothetical protein
MQVVCDMVFVVFRVVFGFGFLFVVGESYLLNHQEGFLGFCATLVHVVALDLVNSKCHVIAFWQGFHFVCCVVVRGHFWFCLTILQF